MIRIRLALFDLTRLWWKWSYFLHSINIYIKTGYEVPHEWPMVFGESGTPTSHYWEWCVWGLNAIKSSKHIFNKSSKYSKHKNSSYVKFYCFLVYHMPMVKLYNNRLFSLIIIIWISTKKIIILFKFLYPNYIIY